MLKFDPTTLADWKSRNIETISITFIASGCEGTTLSIQEDTMIEGYMSIATPHSDLSIYAEPSNTDILKDAYITHTGKKWIMKSDSILTRCGCGKSFGIATGDPKIDKIRLLKSKLAKSKGLIH